MNENHSSPLLIEPMTLQEVEQVLEIEKQCFTQPYSRQILEDELALDVSHLRVLKLGKRIIGFLDYWLVNDEIHLINIAILPEFQRRNYATLLMKYLLEVGREKFCKKIFLDVRQSNEGAIALYQKFGFIEVGNRKRYYSDNSETAIVMEKILV